MYNKKDSIKTLMDEYRALEQSAENCRRRSMWKEVAKSGRDQYRGTPFSDRSWKQGRIPITVDIQNPTWAIMFGFDLEEYYTNPATFIENYLKIMIFRFKNFQDDTFLEKWFPMWGTSVLEGSVFGMDYGFYKDLDPWLSHTPVIADMDDIKRFRDNMPDFKKSGIMPRLIDCYEGCLELIDNDFEVLFPEWCRSVFGVGTYIHGFSDMLVDMMVEPEFTHELLKLITDVRKSWFLGLSEYTGKPVFKGNLYNDEINCPSISPTMYREQLLPFEQELSDFHGGIHYWHSCGNVTNLVPVIASIKRIDLFNCGPWTDVYKAGMAFRDKCPIEICMNPQADILEGTAETMHTRITSIIDDCRRSDVSGFCLKISALNMFKSLDYTVNQIKLWIDVAKKIIDNV